MDGDKIIPLVNPKICKYNEENCISDLVAAGENIYILSTTVSSTSTWILPRIMDAHQAEIPARIPRAS